MPSILETALDAASPEELRALTLSLLRENERLERRSERLERRSNAVTKGAKKIVREFKAEKDTLTRKVAAAEKLAVRDPLTGLYNRRGAEELFAIECARISRAEKERYVGLILLDIDFFKSVNDVYGHSVGDAVLLHVAELVATEGRPTDIALRWGGEEFGVFFSCENEENALKFAERLRKSVEETAFVASGKNISLTISAGVHVIKAEDCASLNAEVEIVDQYLYAAKDNGRNCVVTGTAGSKQIRVYTQGGPARPQGGSQTPAAKGPKEP